MKKVFKMEELDCANCAAKMENLINKVDGVTHASVNFMAQKLTIETDRDSLDEIMQEVVKCVKKIDANCSVVL